MNNNEIELLEEAVLFEEGHLRRSPHILMVYTLSKLIATRENLSKDQKQIVQAAAIVHDIAIKVCKEKYGDACQENQKKEAPSLVKRFLTHHGYTDSQQEKIIELVLTHYDYSVD